MKYVQTILILILGVGGFVLLKYELEPWVKETLCENLVKCEKEGNLHLEDQKS